MGTTRPTDRRTDKADYRVACTRLKTFWMSFKRSRIFIIFLKPSRSMGQKRTPWLLNKAKYTATPIACGRAGAISEVTWSFGQEQWGQRPQKQKKVKCDGQKDQQMDAPMDGRTSRPTNWGVKWRSTQLKIGWWEDWNRKICRNKHNWATRPDWVMNFALNIKQH